MGKEANALLRMLENGGLMSSGGKQMKHIYLNLKRFDISPACGGVNRLASMREWGREIILRTQERLKDWPDTECNGIQFVRRKAVSFAYPRSVQQ